MEKDYQTGLCEFGETVLFRMPGKRRDKVDTACYEGKDTEADGSLVFGQRALHKVRTVQRIVPSKQWNKTLRKALNVTRWDPKGKDTTDTTFVLPPSLGVSGRIPAPPGLDREETVETEPMSEANMEAKSEG